MENAIECVNIFIINITLDSFLNGSECNIKIHTYIKIQRPPWENVKKTLKMAKKRQVYATERKRKKHSLFFSLFLFVENKSFSLLGFCVSVVQTNPFKSVLLFVAI